ncbi:hypothetical protein [Brevibacillus parabrevis]|uniref:hypothetical protein n=1 Tax=Brevibacillus parabrevis TaxID=54914 RepID=UPI0026B3DEB5|nr:hypothetical protein [Brevibacillus parabrevis]MED1725052.1 hypothetical protein [Brevibacillus parabrevis]
MGIVRWSGAAAVAVAALVLAVSSASPPTIHVTGADAKQEETAEEIRIAFVGDIILDKALFANFVAIAVVETCVL